MIPSSFYNQSVMIQEYNPAWPLLFEREAQQLRENLEADFQHIGSTSVPRLAAKPIIDILGIVENISQVDDKRDSLIALGYIPMGEYGIEGRRYYLKQDESAKMDIVHLHIFEKSSPQVKSHLSFRNYLRKNPLAARAYGSLKKNLATQFPDQREQYQEEKGPFIKLILDLAHKPKFRPFLNGKFEYGIEFHCDCFPKGGFSKDVAGRDTGVNGKASYSKPIYTKTLFYVTWACASLIRNLKDFFHWLDGHAVSVIPKSELDDE